MITLDERTEELARRLAEQAGQTPADTIRQLLEERARVGGLGRTAPDNTDEMSDFLERVEAIARRSAARPVLDSRTPDEIIGYDEFGVPR